MTFTLEFEMSKKDLEHEKIKVSIKKIQDIRSRVSDSLRPFVGSVISSDMFDRATAALSFSVPKSCINITCSQDMLSKFTRQPLLAKDLKLISARIAGNIDFILEGNPIYENEWRSRTDWGLVRIFGVEKAVRTFKDGNSQTGAWLDLDIHSGPASGYRIKKFWSNDMFNYARYRLGFTPPIRSTTSKAVSSYPFMDEEFVFGLYFLGYFDHLEIKGDKPEYTKFLCIDYLVNINRKLLRKRLRSLHKEKDFSCPMAIPNSVGCHKCPAGTDKCEAAVRRKSYITGDCKKCGKFSWINPDKPDSCISCGLSLSLHLINKPEVST